MDISKELLVAKIQDPALAAWWNAAPPLPADVDMAEFMAKSLLAAYNAAVETNATLPVGERIDAYPAPSSSTPTVNATGILSSVTTFTCRVRAPLNLDASIAPLI